MKRVPSAVGRLRLLDELVLVDAEVAQQLEDDRQAWLPRGLPTAGPASRRHGWNTARRACALNMAAAVHPAVPPPTTAIRLILRSGSILLEPLRPMRAARLAVATKTCQITARHLSNFAERQHRLSAPKNRSFSMSPSLSRCPKDWRGRRALARAHPVDVRMQRRRQGQAGRRGQGRRSGGRASRRSGPRRSGPSTRMPPSKKRWPHYSRR